MASLEIYEWEIWHTYSSYLQVQHVDLGFAAWQLVESRVALFAALWDGRTYWSSGMDVGSGKAVMDRDPYADHATFTHVPDPGCTVPLAGFALEAWGQACKFRFSEQRVFGEDRPLPPPYVRVFLGQCDLISKGSPPSCVRLYPVLLIYDSGVVLLELRTISPERPTPLDQFVSNSENMFQQPFARIEVPPGLAKLATRAYYHSQQLRFDRRALLLWLERRHDLAVDQLTRRQKAGDFTFDLAPLSGADGDHPCEYLHTFALTLFQTVAFVLGRSRRGLAFVMLGPKRTPELGDFWSGRPHMYLTRFAGQRDTATENHLCHGEAFGCIFLRVPNAEGAIAKRYLPEDARIFEDYSAYISSHATLWVWSRNGIDQNFRWADPNRGHLIYERQAVVELLEYGYMLHRGLLERIDTYADADDVMAARKEVLRLQQHMEEVSPSGEIRDLLHRGWDQMGVPKLLSRIQEGLGLRETETRTVEARSAARAGQALTILFGLMAVPALAGQVIQPLWELLNIPHPHDIRLFMTIANVISLVGVGGIVGFLVRWSNVGRLKASK
ncbi:MAG: hypothetical protein ACYDA9_00560 [Terriglobia bacterium]